MKKLMKIAVILTLNFLVLSFSLTKTQISTPASTRGPASSSSNLTHKKSWSFNYKDLSKKPFQIKKEAFSFEDAFKAASVECFQQLTQGKYPGEEKGLDIIDICANPKI